MRQPRLYTSQPLSPNTVIELDSGPAHHLARVLRAQPGQAVTLFNGDGRDYPGRIELADKRNVTVALGAPVDLSPESPLNIELGIAISKGDRMDWVIQKATELGVTAIAPLITERVEVRLKGGREERRLLHWQGIAIAACEQCGRNRVPTIHPPQSLASWLTDCSAERRFVLHHRTDGRLEAANKPVSAALLIGPEGGLTMGEIGRAEQTGFEPLRLGPRVLRTETAPLVALSVLQFALGDLAL